MVLVNQLVADEVATLVARHRYEVEDARDAVKAAETASAAKNEEIKQAAAERQAHLVEQIEKDKAQAEKPRNDWGIQRGERSNEISVAVDDDECEEPPRAAAPPPAPAPPAPPKPAPRHQPVFDDDEDFGNQTWLR